MIHYLVTREHLYTMEVYLQTWGRRLRTQVNIVSYDRLVAYRSLPRGTWVFSDLERLTHPQLDLARRAWDALAAVGGPGVRLLNDPHRVLRREPLLRALRAAGLNPFAVHRIGEDRSAVRFPAFVRRASEHDGNLSPLLRTAADLDRAVAELTKAGAPADDLLVIEFCDTADGAGVYRKYSAMRAGPDLLPRHLFHGHHWMLKHADFVDDATVAEESAYLRDNPHAADLARIFDLAHIDYGRIDYAVATDGRLVTWEINTNPTITVEPAKIAPPRLTGQAAFAEAFHGSMTALNAPADGPPVPFAVPGPLQSALGHPIRRRLLRRAGRALQRVGRLPPLRPLWAATE